MNQKHHNTNKNLKQLSPETLIIGIDISKKSHVARAVDYRGMELSTPKTFKSDLKGFMYCHRWIRELLAMHGKKDTIVGVEPTGPYGNTLIHYLRSHDVKVVLVLGSQVAKAKELDDNTPSKNDFKDALTICGLIRDGRFRKLREFDDETHELKEAMATHRQLTKNTTRIKCQIDNWICSYFPEFSIAFKDWTKKTAFATLKACPMPKSIVATPPAELVKTWRNSGVIKGIGIKKAEELRRYAKSSIGLKTAPIAAEIHIKDLVLQYELLLERMDALWSFIDALVKHIPLHKTLSGIPDIGEKAICGIIAEIGDPTDFSHPKQLVRLSGLSLKESSSGGKRGMSQITKRGRPMLRHWLYLAVLNLLKNKNSPFWELHQYYTKRKENPLKKMQSITALCCKLLRIIHGMATKGAVYDPSYITAGIPAVNAA